MYSHRFREQLDTLYPTHEAMRPVMCAGFVACPLPLVAAMTGGLCAMHQQIYQRAFEQAQAVVRPSWLERAFAFNGN